MLLLFFSFFLFKLHKTLYMPLFSFYFYFFIFILLRVTFMAWNISFCNEKQNTTQRLNLVDCSFYFNYIFVINRSYFIMHLTIWREREREREIDRQADRHTKINKHTHKQTDTQTEATIYPEFIHWSPKRVLNAIRISLLTPKTPAPLIRNASTAAECSRHTLQALPIKPSLLINKWKELRISWLKTS